MVMRIQGVEEVRNISALAVVGWIGDDSAHVDLEPIFWYLFLGGLLDVRRERDGTRRHEMR